MKSSSTSVIFLSIIFFMAFQSSAQNIVLSEYFVSDGLPSANINCIYQDHQGLLWIGTSNGLAVFDGNEFDVLDQRHGLSDQKISCITQDQHFVFWIGHQDGSISSINKQNNFIQQHQFGIKSTINCIIEDSTGTFWIASDRHGLFKSASMKDSLIEAIDFKGLTGKIKHFNDLTSHDNNNLLAATDTGLMIIYNLRNEKVEFEIFNRLNSKLQANGIYKIKPQSENEYLLVTDNGLFTLTVSDKVNFSVLANNSNESMVYKDLVLDNEENRWMISNQGFHKLKNNRTQTFGAKDLDNAILKSLYIDNQSNIWIGSQRGLFRYTYKEFTQYPIDQMSDLKILDITLDKYENIWIGSNTGLFRITGKNLQNKEYETIIENKPVNALFADSKGNIWAGINKSNEIIHYNPNTKKSTSYTRKDGYYFTHCSSIIEDVNNNILISSFMDTGLLSYTYPKRSGRRTPKGSFGSIHNAMNLPADKFTILYRTQNDGYWISSVENGLIYMKNDSIRYFENNNEISDFGINEITEDNQGNVWISTLRNGLYQYNGVFFNHIGLNEGLNAKTVFSMQSDDFDDIWLVTETNLQKYDQYNEKFYDYSLSSDIRIDENYGKLIKTKQGKLWLTTAAGMIFIRPGLSQMTFTPHKPFIEQIKVFNESFNYLDYADAINPQTYLPVNLKFTPEINHVSFEYTVTEFTDNDPVYFRYKLEPYEKNWQPLTTNRTAIYTNLLAGNYTFYVQSMYNDEWSEATAYSFKIKAALYRQIWFYIVVALAVILVVYLIIILRIRYFKKLNVMLKESYADRTKLLSSAYSNIESNIKYAKNIQSAVLRKEEDLAKIFPNSFVFSKPKVSVGGDFFWHSRKSRKLFIAVADCIGHGVPGAFMSLIGHNLLNQTINEIDSFDPPFILEEVSRNFIRAIKNTQLDIEENNDMDIAFCRIDKDRNEIFFSGANSTIYFIHKNKLNEYRGNRRAIGEDHEVRIQFSRERIKYESGDMLYMFTNGFADQFGGPENKRFRTTRLKNLLVNLHDLNLDDQKAQIMDTFDKWKGENEQIDDVLLLGIRL